jgi:peptide/nickel transport system permease protein
VSDAHDRGLEQARQGGPGGAFPQTAETADALLEVPSLPPGTPPRPTRGPTAIAMARLRKDKGAVIGFCFIVFVSLVAIFAPLVVGALGHPPNETTFEPLTESGLPKGAFGGINSDYLLGIEPQVGRDIFSRIVYGARISLGISLSATILTIVLGTVMGSIAGFFPGKLDMTVSRLMDLLLAFPGLLFIITLIGAVPESFPRPLLIVLVLGGFGWPYIGRLVRTLVLSLREREFVEAARVSGAGEWRIMFREVMPNLAGPLLTYATLVIPGFIVAEAALSYLGVGVKVPTASWGAMLSDASSFYTVDPTFLAVPGLALFLTVFAFNLVGDGVSEAFNPKSLR